MTTPGPNLLSGSTDYVNNTGGGPVSGNFIVNGSPGLLPLAYNGGSLPTVALQVGSPAIDAGSNAAAAGLTIDQRGLNRPVNGIVDLGAHEYQPPATTTTVTSSLNPSNVGQSVTFTVAVTATATNSNTVPGSVTITVDSTSTVVPLVNGVATLTTSTLTAGTHAAYAVFYGSTLGDINFSISNSSALIQTVNPLSQTITFGPLSPVTYGVGPITLRATGGASGNPVTFSVVSGPGSISGTTLTVTGAGSIVVEADQAGNANYAAAAPVQQTEVVNKANQTITFSPLSPVTYGVAPITLSATGGGSGNPVTFSVISGPGSISGNMLTVTGAGSIVVQADEAGNANYNAAIFVQQTEVVNPASQTITFGPLSPVTYGVGPIALTASSSSGLPVTYTVISGPGSISGNILTVTGAGSIVVQAHQAGNANYSAAALVQQVLIVNPLPVSPISPAPPAPPAQFPFVSVAITTTGQEVLEVVSSSGVLTEYNSRGHFQLATGVHSASVAFGAAGEVMLVVYQDGRLVQYDAAGAHQLANGVLSAGVGLNAGQEVVEVVFANGGLVQFDANGTHFLATNVRTVSVDFGANSGQNIGHEVLDVVFADGIFLQFDDAGSHQMARSIGSAGAAVAPTGLVVDLICLDGSL